MPTYFRGPRALLAESRTLLAAAQEVLICRKANSTAADQNLTAETGDKVGAADCPI